MHITGKRAGLRVDPGPSEAPADGERQGPEQRAGERAEQDGGHALRSAHGRRTLTEKIIADHLVAEGDEEIELGVDEILLEDATGTMACLQFEQLGLDRVAVPTVSYVDHNVIQFDNRNPEDHAYLRSWAMRYGALYSRPGNGIAHYLHLERFARPGRVLVGADSHTTMAGALGMLAIGAGRDRGSGRDGGPALRRREAASSSGSSSAAGWSRGCSRRTSCSSCSGGAAYAAAAGASSSSTATASQTLSATDRGTICNMVMETGATTGIFPSDDRTRAWLADQGREEHWLELAADPGAAYDETETIDLGEPRAADRAPLVAGERRARCGRRPESRRGRCASAPP